MDCLLEFGKGLFRLGLAGVEGLSAFEPVVGGFELAGLAVDHAQEMGGFGNAALLQEKQVRQSGGRTASGKRSALAGSRDTERSAPAARFLFPPTLRTMFGASTSASMLA